MEQILNLKCLFSDKCCVWFIAVLTLTEIWAVVDDKYQVNVVILQETNNTDINVSYNETNTAFNFSKIYLDVWSYGNYTYIYRNVSCDGEGTAAIVAELHCEIDIGVFIGPSCTRALNEVLPLAKSWNIPVFTPVGSGATAASLSSMVTKFSPYSVWSYAYAFKAILTLYEWYNIVFIFNEGSTESVTFKDGVMRYLDNYPIFSQKSFSFNEHLSSSVKLTQMLIDASAEARVFILACGSSRSSRAMMLRAYKLGYATSGEYVFFIVDELSKTPSTKYWQMGQPDDQIVLKSLGHVLWPYITVYRDKHSIFLKYMAGRLNHLDVDDSNRTEINPYLSGYTDALLTYDESFYRTVKDYKGDPLNGSMLIKNVWNQTFYSFGLDVYFNINEFGYRQSNVTFGFFNMTTGKLENGGYYHSKYSTMEISSKGFDWPYSNGVSPLNKPKCGFKNNLCDVASESLSNSLVGAIGALVALVGVIGFIGAVCMYRNWKIKQKIELWWWKIKSSDLVIAAHNNISSISLKHSKYSVRNSNTLDNTSFSDKVTESKVAIWKGQTVGLRQLPIQQLIITKAVLVELKQLRDVSHPNVTRVLGACLEDSLKALVTECCIKGTLQDLLGNNKITLDYQFKCSLSRDIINGLCYIHQSPIHKHGRLNSNVCLIDNRFSVKLTDFGLPSLFGLILVDTTSNEYKSECKWKAPEILRSGATATGTVEGDIYSYGMILLEIITQDSPFATEIDYMTIDEIILKIQDGGDSPFRPEMELPQSLSNLKELIQKCWAECPKERPTSQSVKGLIKQISISLGDNGNLLENLMKRMELYANNLEKMVEEKTGELKEEKKKSEELLYQILPRSVAERLKSGLRVDPEAYDGVSIYFSDIVGFTEISAVSSPMEIKTFLTRPDYFQNISKAECTSESKFNIAVMLLQTVVDLLNDIYSCFDAVIEEFDVYKVETIGDAYMVVSGLPQRNGNLHALNIARMSMKLLEAVREFKIRHMPAETVRIRIGLHSGPVCAGVVGSKMPRYCLFGDTVNTASRMESSGKAMMIHVSASLKQLLDQFGSFHIIPRGNIAVKGKGDMLTYWLLTSHNETPDLLADVESQ